MRAANAVQASPTSTVPCCKCLPRSPRSAVLHRFHWPVRPLCGADRPEEDGDVLDLCSSWTSHYRRLARRRVVALGLNPLELAANPSKTEWCGRTSTRTAAPMSVRSSQTPLLGLVARASRATAPHRRASMRAVDDASRRDHEQPQRGLPDAASRAPGRWRACSSQAASPAARSPTGASRPCRSGTARSPRRTTQFVAEYYHFSSPSGRDRRGGCLARRLGGAARPRSW